MARENFGRSITCRIAVGPRAGQKLFTSQTIPPRLQRQEGDPNGATRAGGICLHASVDIAPHQREKLERLCRYVSRAPVASERLAFTASGQVRYTLKDPVPRRQRTSCWSRWILWHGWRHWHRRRACT